MNEEKEETCPSCGSSELQLRGDIYDAYFYCPDCDYHADAEEHSGNREALRKALETLQDAKEEDTERTSKEHARLVSDASILLAETPAGDGLEYLTSWRLWDANRVGTLWLLEAAIEELRLHGTAGEYD